MSNVKNQSGSQSPDQLHILCRLLLLQAQMTYHNSRKEESQKIEEVIENEIHNTAASKNIDYSAGMYNQLSNVKAKVNPTTIKKKLDLATKLPHILQSCVGLGTHSSELS